MSVTTVSGRRAVVLARRPVPIVLTRGGLLPIVLLATGFALYNAGARPSLVLTAALVGGLGGAVSLIVHELGHVRAARRVDGVRPQGVSLIWMGAATEFRGAYRTGRQQVRVALGGPVASLGFALALTVATAIPLPWGLQYGCFGLALLNAAIAFLTLIPVHPLDGHKLIVGLVWWAAGGEERARKIVRRAGLACLSLDASVAAYALIEKPVLGAVIVVMGAAAYSQKRLFRSPRVPSPRT